MQGKIGFRNALKRKKNDLPTKIENGLSEN